MYRTPDASPYLAPELRLYTSFFFALPRCPFAAGSFDSVPAAGNTQSYSRRNEPIRNPVVGDLGNLFNGTDGRTACYSQRQTGEPGGIGRSPEEKVEIDDDPIGTSARWRKRRAGLKEEISLPDVDWPGKTRLGAGREEEISSIEGGAESYSIGRKAQ
ncbi:hypothetical protein KSP40_PGU012890 [Platanthera guangdongensis]|uniref:Uncharacterized protein n=1 Tax=Platanthera guangdongensis TaxID=2320717 RepID=A0ABR2LZW4_9ASPA